MIPLIEIISDLLTKTEKRKVTVCYVKMKHVAKLRQPQTVRNFYWNSEAGEELEAARMPYYRFLRFGCLNVIEWQCSRG